MNIFKRLFSRKQKENIDVSYDEEAMLDKSELDFNDPVMRSRYIMGCLEQMEEGSREVELLSEEYQLVTDYLTDIEEIESLPENVRENINELATHLIGFYEETERYKAKKHRMSDIEYYTLRKHESEVEEGIRKVREAEKYAGLIKKDLRRLDGERHAHEFHVKELEMSLKNLKGMMMIFIVAYIFLMLMLVIFQLAFGYEVFIGYILATALVAIASTIVAVKYMNHDKERLSCATENNKIIQLQNTVKIRYVNNRKFLEFLYLKYHVENGEKLAKLWHEYQREKEERRQFIEAEAKSDFYRNELLSALKKLYIKFPERWPGLVNALLDKKEMVEVKHELIVRRQAIREQMDNNKKIAEKARDEIKKVANDYPQYAKEILDLVDSQE